MTINSNVEKQYILSEEDIACILHVRKLIEELQEEDILYHIYDDDGPQFDELLYNSRKPINVHDEIE